MVEVHLKGKSMEERRSRVGSRQVLGNGNSRGVITAITQSIIQTATMRDVIRRDARYNPQTVGNQQQTVVPAGAAPVQNAPTPPSTGWRDWGPLQSPPGQDAIERIANALAPRGPKPKAGEKQG